jgi:hypothetical protein
VYYFSLGWLFNCFNFQKDKGGLGGVIYSLIVALHYTKIRVFKLGLIEEGRYFPRLNGCIDDIKEEVKDWHSYFTTFTFVKEKDVIETWSYYPHDFTTNVPKNIKKIKWYSDLVKNEIFMLRDDIKVQIDNRIIESGFNSNTDIVLHIRRTDKIFASKGSWIESGELPIDIYIEETMHIVKKIKIKPRVFLCTDDKKICPEIFDKFSEYNIEVLWDKNEPDIPFHAMYMAGELKKSVAFEENLVALKNIYIMSQSLYLIGGRMSYFFQLAELLRYPLPTKNIKDNDKFGKAHYAETDEPMINAYDLDDK